MSIGELIDKIPVAVKALCCLPALVVVWGLVVASAAFLMGQEPER